MWHLKCLRRVRNSLSVTSIRVSWRRHEFGQWRAQRANLQGYIERKVKRLLTSGEKSLLRAFPVQPPALAVSYFSAPSSSRKLILSWRPESASIIVADWDWVAAPRRVMSLAALRPTALIMARQRIKRCEVREKFHFWLISCEMLDKKASWLMPLMTRQDKSDSMWLGVLGTKKVRNWFNRWLRKSW